MPTVITMPDGDNITLGFSTENEEIEREALDVISKYCGEEFTRWYISETVAPYDEYDEAKSYESQNEEYADAFRDIADIIYEYRTKVFDKKARLNRKDLDSFITAISGIVDDMI